VQPLTGTDGGRMAFWSPDSRSIAFFADASLKRMDIETGTIVPLANAPEAHPGTWSDDGTILFTPFTGSPILRVSDRGGDAVAVESAAGVARLYPRFLLGGRHFLYVTGPAPRGIYVAQLNGSERQRLVTGTSVEYAPSGYLLFTRDRTVFAQPFDPESLELRGSPVQVADQVIAMSVATDSTLVFRSGADAGRELVWFDRSGKEVSRPSGPGNNPSLSPDGNRVALARVAPGAATRPDIWILGLARDVFSPVTAPPGLHHSPLWSPDGANIVFASARVGKPFALYQRSAAGGGDERLLLEEAGSVIPNDWSPNGRFLIYRRDSVPPGNVEFNLWALSLDDKRTFPLVQTGFHEREAQFSPDGRWFAYQSNESGRFEIYIRPFPDAGRTRYGPVSTNGGVQVRWRRDGKELFYVGLDSTLMAVPIQATPTGDPIAGPPVPLFRANVGVGDNFGVQNYAVSSDGTRFLIDRLQEVTAPITVVLNWKPKE
jgi:Tol biopolymer transport system component